jgi:hypothetical protein
MGKEKIIFSSIFFFDSVFNKGRPPRVEFRPNCASPELRLGSTLSVSLRSSGLTYGR